MNLQQLPSAQRLVTPWQRVRQLLDLVMSWVPLLLLVAALLLSIWLVRSTPSLRALDVVKPPVSEADYDVRGFTLKTYDLQGRLKSSMTGLSAVHSPQTLTTFVEQPRVLIYKDGRVTSAAANQARANEDGSEVQLFGHAVIHRAASDQTAESMNMRSEFFHFFANTDAVQTHLPVEISKGKNSFKANSMHADNLNQLFDMKGRVKVVMYPAEKP